MCRDRPSEHTKIRSILKQVVKALFIYAFDFDPSYKKKALAFHYLLTCCLCQRHGIFPRSIFLISIEVEYILKDYYKIIDVFQDELLEKYKLLPKVLKSRSFLKHYFFSNCLCNFKYNSKIIPMFQDFSILYIDSLLFHC